ncbi:hypothetical protein Zmor_014036 [Zophobas morio]|uniref:Uncharacterized protein n=1 Tax=Zophobas morio TaxID=2755281 RepID=A0AA38IBH1_9CUCU|nr:hypothetical protein Zmor_014036 [Zophobas morio]
MSSTYTFILSLLLFVGFSSSKKIPPYLTLCSRHDPNLNECVKNAVEQLRPHLALGVPELLLPPMDPLVLPEAGLSSGDNFKASFKNIQIYYANEFRIDNLNVNLDKYHIDLELSFPRLRILSQYNIDGRILVLQLHGHGPADGNFTDVSANAAFEGELKSKKGKEYITIKSVKVDLKIGKPFFQFENIFNGNEELNVQTNKIINENVVDIIDELRPVIDKTVTDFAIGIVSRVFNRFSFDELFPK